MRTHQFVYVTIVFRKLRKSLHFAKTVYMSFCAEINVFTFLGLFAYLLYDDVVSKYLKNYTFDKYVGEIYA